MDEAWFLEALLAQLLAIELDAFWVSSWVRRCERFLVDAAEMQS